MTPVLAQSISGTAVLMVLLSPLMLVGNFVGYWLAGRLLVKRHPEIETRPVVLGAMRTIVALATAYAVLQSMLLGPWAARVPVSFAVPLLPIRAVEWAVLLWIWWGRRPGRSRLGPFAVDVAWGTALSFLMDLGLAYWFLFSGGLRLWL